LRDESENQNARSMCHVSDDGLSGSAVGVAIVLCCGDGDEDPSNVAHH
jgi:hypothetical protein